MNNLERGLLSAITCVLATLPGALAAAELPAAIRVDHDCIDPTDRAIPVSYLDAARKLVVLFGHQSVGDNVLRGLQALAEGNPTFYGVSVRADGDTGESGGGIVQFAVGHNGDPNSKIDHFRERVNGQGATAPFDVAMMKLCFVDLPPRFDPAGVAAHYEQVMEELEAAHPSTRFVWWTQPLKTSGNAAQNAFNREIRAYSSAHGKTLFDLADIESHDRQGRESADDSGPALVEGYSTDGGHLNNEGAGRMARAWWWLLARLRGWSGSSEGRPAVSADAPTAPATSRPEPHRPAPAAGTRSGDVRDKLRRASDLIRERKLAEAETLLVEACAVDVASMAAHLQLGSVFERQGKLQEAEREYRTGVKLNPDSGWAHGVLGLLLARQDRLEEARTELATAVRVEPRNTRAREAFESFSRAHPGN